MERKILRIVQELFEGEDNIAWGTMAQFENGYPCMWEDPNAARFNPCGAIRHAARALRLKEDDFHTFVAKAEAALARYVRYNVKSEITGNSSNFAVVHDWSDDATREDIISAIEKLNQRPVEANGVQAYNQGCNYVQAD